MNEPTDPWTAPLSGVEVRPGSPTADADKARYDHALALVCSTAFEWAGEYGFTDPDGAARVWAAATFLRPDLEPRRGETR